MKKIILALALIVSSIFANGQCTTNNATGCRCKDSTQTDCDLLPDIEIGRPPFYVYYDDFGIKEYAQTGNANPDDNGRLYVTVSTPQTGFGPLEILATDTFVCGTDTIIGTAPAICPDGVTYPKILVDQRIYHKNTNGTMSHYDRPAGTMTYHPTHNHMHVDNWGNYTLRTRDTLEPNPLNWPLIGAGTKLAFCVEDYGTCEEYPDHCLDANGNSLNHSSDFPNFGLGGGSYNCSPVVQGISSGYVDIYWTTLAGMYVTIPPDICNGLYYIVCEVDPNHNFLEEDETNNVYAAPFVVKRQLPNPAVTPLNIEVANSAMNVCQGESVSLTAAIDMPNVTYLWSNGDTTSTISATTSGTYTVDVTNQCGTGTSLPVSINVIPQPALPVGTNDTISVPGYATISANSPFPIQWYDQPVGGSPIDTGSILYTPFINSTTTFYAQVEEKVAGAQFPTGLSNNMVSGSGGYSNSNNALIFDCINPFILHAVTVYSQSNGSVIVVLKDSNGNILQSAPATVVIGQNIITLDFNITPGTGYQITRTGTDLYRNNPQTNLGYPFQIPNIMSITTSTQGDGYYYFFYNWDIRLPDHSCLSQRTPVLAVVANPNSIADAAVLRSLVVYPNPAKNSVKISFSTNDKEATIDLGDNLGKTVLSKTIFSSGDSFEENLNISSFSKGVYFIHILTSGKNLYKKLVIE
jgi:hypothetical protein